MRFFQLTLIALFLGAASLCVAQEQSQRPQETKADSSAKEKPKGEVALALEELKKRGEEPVPVVGTSSKDPDDKITAEEINDRATKLVQPVFPPMARAVRASGKVVVLVLIDTEGKVIAAEALSGHPLLFTAAVTAARASEFTGTKLDGKPVYVTGKIIYNFVIQ